MNSIALRLSAMSLQLEGCGMPEIVEALQIAEREIIRLEALIPPKPKKLVMVCGVDCHPGDDNCNNYCNMAPQKGPMADQPLPGPDAMYPNHVQSEDCWCSPTLDYVDPETGAQVWVHHVAS